MYTTLNGGVACYTQQHQWQEKAAPTTYTQPREQKKRKRNSQMERINEAKQINILGILIACIVDDAKDGKNETRAGVILGH